MLQLIKEIAVKILCWKQVEGWWMKSDKAILRVATESWHSWPEYFRPDKHIVHAWLIRDELAKRFGTKQETQFKGKRIIITYETGNIVSEASDIWKLNVGNELHCLVAIEHWRKLHDKV